MVIGTLELHLRMEGSFSLKDKRRLLRPLIERIRNDYHVAVAEVGDMDLWNSAVLGVACVSNDAAHAESILQHVIDHLDGVAEVELEGVVRDVTRY
jgi:uncharacterized protein